MAQSKQDSVRYSIRPTIFEKDQYWCRYCGATSNLKAGAWVYECKENCSKALQLKNIPDLIRPLSQQICYKCRSSDSSPKNPILQCDGCPRAIHTKCYKGKLPKDLLKVKRKWYCSSRCRPLKSALKRKSISEPLAKKKVKVEPATPPPDDFLDYNIPKFIKKEIETPNWKIIIPKRSKRGKRVVEDLTDEAFVERHKRCEALEKEDRPPV